MRAVCWRLPTWNPDVASVRYRAAIPARHLERLGVRSRFSAGAYGVLEPERPDAVVFVKAFGDRDVELARRATAERVPVILDVTDNVFAPGYRAHSPDNFRVMAETASMVVTTGPALQEVLRRELGTSAPIHVVADPVETPEDVRAAARTMWRAWIRRAWTQRRSELPRAVAGVTANGLVPALRRQFRRRGQAAPPRVLWFGNVGSIEPRFGLVNLVDIAPQLEAAAAEISFRLVVVTGDRAAYRREIATLGLDSEFEPWDRLSIFRQVQESALVIVPNSRDEFSICKSPNRSVLALSQGVPVVATRIPSMEAFEGAVLFDDFRDGVLRYLRDPALAATHLRRAASVIEREFAPQVVAATWLRILEEVSPSRMRRDGARGPSHVEGRGRATGS